LEHILQEQWGDLAGSEEVERFFPLHRWVNEETGPFSFCPDVAMRN